MGPRTKDSQEHLAGKVRITIQTDINHGFCHKMAPSQPVSEQGNCYESILNNWALEIFGHRSFYLQMISACCEGTVTADSGAEIKKEKSSGRRGEGKLVPGRAEPGKKK